MHHNYIFDTPQDVVFPPGCQGSHLTHTEPAANLQPQIPVCKAALQPLLSHFPLPPGLTSSQVQNPVLVSVGKAHMGQSLWKGSDCVRHVLDWLLDTLCRIYLALHFGCLQCKSIYCIVMYWCTAIDCWSSYTVFLINYISLSVTGDSSHLSYKCK